MANASRIPWRQGDFVVVPRSLLALKLSPAELRVWLALASFCYDTDTCWPSHAAMIADRLPPGTTASTIRKAKRGLERKGLLVTEQRHTGSGRETSNVYRIMAPVQTDREGGRNGPPPRSVSTPLEDDKGIGKPKRRRKGTHAVIDEMMGELG